MRDNRKNEIDIVQASQYSYPYHYLPSVSGFPNFSKTWGFSASYIAAIHLFIEWINNNNIGANKSHVHMDYGCGDGGFIYHVAAEKLSENIEFYGIDYDERAIEWAKQFSDPNKFIYGDVANLPPSYYDSGSLVEVYEHIPPNECSNFLKNISKSLKKGAPFFVTVPSTQKAVSTKHYRHFDFETLSKEFGEYFVVENIFGFERNTIVSKIFFRLLFTHWWNLESKLTNKILINTLKRKYTELYRCGRICVYLKKK